MVRRVRVSRTTWVATGNWQPATTDTDRGDSTDYREREALPALDAHSEAGWRGRLGRKVRTRRDATRRDVRRKASTDKRKQSEATEGEKRRWLTELKQERGERSGRGEYGYCARKQRKRSKCEPASQFEDLSVSLRNLLVCTYVEQAGQGPAGTFGVVASPSTSQPTKRVNSNAMLEVSLP